MFWYFKIGAAINKIIGQSEKINLRVGSWARC
jgi:hypothetical protein